MKNLFEWNELFSFAPYTSTEVIYEVILEGKMKRKKLYIAILTLVVGIIIVAGIFIMKDVMNRDKSSGDETTAPVDINITVTPIAPSPTSMVEKGEKEEKEEKEDKIIVTVHNYDELIKNLQSNREIRLLPGNYTYSDGEEIQVCLEGLSNVTLRGVPDQPLQYISLLTGFQIKSCSNIEVFNLDIGYQDTEFQDFYSAFVIEKSDTVMIDTCKVRAGCLFLGDYLGDDYQDNKDVVIQNSWLVGTTGTCYIWSNYPGGFPTPNEYTVDIGAQQWGIGSDVDSIYYEHTKLSFPDLTFINTYDGNDYLAENHQFIEFQNTLLKTFSENEIYLSEDRMRDKLVININLNKIEDEAKIINTVIPKLSTFRDKIFSIAENAYIAIWTQGEYGTDLHQLYILDAKDSSVRLISNIQFKNRVDFEDSIFVPSDNKEDEYHQKPWRMFDYQSSDYYSFSVVESYSGSGDFMYYNTDVVICTNKSTKDSFVCCKEGFYQVLECTQENKDAYHKAISSYLEKQNNEFVNYLNREVFAPVKRIDQPNTLYVIFLQREKTDFEMDYSEAEFRYSYKLAEVDDSGKVVNIAPLTVRPFEECVPIEDKMK